MNTKLTVPTVHLNGSSARSLIDGYGEAAKALYEAIGSLRTTAPHGRDYYVSQDPAALMKATLEHKARCEKLAGVLEELQELAIAVQEQEDARVKR